LHQLGAVVKGYALQPEDENDHYLLINGDSLCDSVIADIRDKEKIKEAILSFQPDFIFHFGRPAIGFASRIKNRYIHLK
jgi:CDP-glucose 4,6-dehydratase